MQRNSKILFSCLIILSLIFLICSHYIYNVIIFGVPNGSGFTEDGMATITVRNETGVKNIPEDVARVALAIKNASDFGARDPLPLSDSKKKLDVVEQNLNIINLQTEDDLLANLSSLEPEELDLLISQANYLLNNRYSLKPATNIIAERKKRNPEL